MFRSFMIAAASGAVLTLSATVFAQQNYGTADEAKAMLLKAVAALKADKTKTLDQINDGQGGFVDHDLYVFCANVGDGIETISRPEDAFDEEGLDTQKIDSTKLDPAELAQHTAMEAGYFDGPIPADIAAPPGSSPKRAELARFLEWRRQTENEIEILEEAHHRAIEALGGEATTKRKIDALIEADVNEILRFALDGQQITAKKLRAFERKQLEQKLKDDRHAAQVASKTLGQIEHQIEVKNIGLDFLDNRTERFVKSAVVEAARESDLGERYLQKIGELRDVWLQLIGLRIVVGEHDGFASGPMYGSPKIEIPRFGLPALACKELQISVSQLALDKAAAPWRALANELVKNPNADAKIGSAQH